MLRNQITLLLILAVLFSSCIKEQFDPGKFNASLNLEPGLAVPVGYSKLGVEKYLRDASKDNILQISQDGFLSLYFSESVTSGNLGGLLSFDHIGLNKDFRNETGFPIYVPTGGPGLDFADTILVPITCNYTSARIDRILIRSGNFQTGLDAQGLTGNITYEFPGLHLIDGESFIRTMNFSDPDMTIPLAGCNIIPEHDAGGNNFLKCILSVHLDSTSDSIPADSSILSFQTDLDDFNFETIYGNLSGFDIPIPSIHYAPSIFSQIAEGQFEFTDPKIKLFFSNSVGVPVGISFSQIEAIDRNNNHLSLTGSEIPPPGTFRSITRPSLSQIGEAVSDSIILDNKTSNLPAILGSNPNLINITAAARIGPPEGTDTAFIRYDSKYDLTATIEIPIWGKAEFFVLLDTLDFDYLSTSLPVPDELERLIVRIILTNGFPVKVTPQVYLLDENRGLLDSIFTTDQGINGGKDTNGDGKVDPVPQDPIDIDLPRTKINNLVNARYLVTRGSIMTTGFPAEDVKFYVDYYLHYNIGLIAQLKINTGK